ncbi:mRNA splicing protein [Saccharomycopsis crataegensis]|uniref:RNA helicase n=1 Tax=Saccharomycopsis crataegensis TaxID=43959 RepID=A0AAV5QKN8_9ASCO|nr:mRNA splicing protein [Saccharomycopsis crataegensis]
MNANDGGDDDDDDAFKIVKPTFLKKSKRQKLIKEKANKLKEEELMKKQQLVESIKQKKAKKLLLERQISTNAISDSQKPVKKPRANRDSKHKKFAFEWNNEDDTSSDYQPLVAYNSVDSGIQKSLSKKLNWDDKHWTEKSLDEMTSRDWRILKEDFEIGSKGSIAENPLRSWKESQIPERVLGVIDLLGYKQPTPIQRAAIPIALNNKDVLGIAETGSGKTLSFVVPLLSYLNNLPKLNSKTKNDGPYGLILAPTRELAQQIHLEVTKFTKHLRYNAVAIFGGHQLETNAFDMQDGVEILIATPGRLLDCLDRKILVLNQCFYLVMDEADRMIDMGFEEQVNKILSALPKIQTTFGSQVARRLKIKRNITMMYTATMPPAIEKMTSRYLDRPNTIVIGNPEKAADTVEQKVEFVTNDEMKNRKLLDVLSSRKYRPPIIIFVNYKKTIEALHELIESNTKLKSVVIHGSKSQDQREYAIKSLRNGKYDILIATDVAGRGIDIPNISLVINYQMSKNIEDYVHRIGRTGRAGSTGTAITYLNGEDDKAVLYDLKNMIGKSQLSRCPDELKRHPAAMIKPNQFKAIND